MRKKMRFIDLIKQNSWLSVALTLLELFPKEKNNISGYENIFLQLGSMPVIQSDMTIDIQYEIDDFDNKEYVDVSGRKKHDPANKKNQNFSYALEFIPWSEWLGIQISQRSLKNFTELEIISHCLFEMTFISFDEKEIKKEMNKLNDSYKEYESLTVEEKKLRSVSLKDLKRQKKG